MSSNRSLLRAEPLPTPIQDRAHNPVNGGDAERYAMARLVIACRGEGQWSSREEDNSKIDLIFSCDHPWYTGERLLVLSQVKSGRAYGEITERGFKLSSKAKSAARRTSHGICVVWVDRDANRAFWAYVHPEVSLKPQEYGRHHEVCPATLYDLARCMSVKKNGLTGAKGIIVRRRASEISARRQRVKNVYRSFGKINSPVLGEISLTRLGWRHMFRSGRLKENKAASLDLVPHLKRLLSRCPSTQAITASEFWCHNGYEYRRCEHLLKYESLMTTNDAGNLQNGLVAHVRVIEELRYPSEWVSQVMLSQLVSRRLVLKSAYFKPKAK